jgi:hypothetical protein
MLPCVVRLRCSEIMCISASIPSSLQHSIPPHVHLTQTTSHSPRNRCSIPATLGPPYDTPRFQPRKPLAGTPTVSPTFFHITSRHARHALPLLCTPRPSTPRPSTPRPRLRRAPPLPAHPWRAVPSQARVLLGGCASSPRRAEISRHQCMLTSLSGFLSRRRNRLRSALVRTTA